MLEGSPRSAGRALRPGVRVVARVVPEEPDAGPVRGVLPELPEVWACAVPSPIPTSKQETARVEGRMVENVLL